MKKGTIASLYVLVLLCNVLGIEREFLIVANPATTLLYNQYEQPLLESEKNDLPSGMPLEILAKKQLMGDRITWGMKLSFQNSLFYLLLDESGIPSGLPRSAGAHFFKNCIAYSDTVIIAASSIVIAETYPANGKKHLLKSGERVIRIFSQGRYVYCYHQSNHFFGWISSGPSTFSKKKDVPSTLTKTSSFTYLHSRIMKRLEHVNNRYDTLFSFFNSITGQERVPPVWNYSGSLTAHIYKLDYHGNQAGSMESSINHVVSDIRNILSGKPFSVDYNNGIITILPAEL